MSEATDDKKIKASDHDSYGTLTLIAVLLPFIGLIIGIVYITKDKKVDRKLGEHLIAYSILFMIIWSVGWIVLTNLSTPSIYQNY